MLHHGINTYKDDTNFATVKTAGVGIPFFVGAWPCHTAGGFTGKPQLITSFSDAEKLGGYSEEWRTSNGSPKWTLCMAVYACLKAMAVSPVIVYNVFDPSSHKEAVAAADIGVTDHIATLSLDALDTEALVVKASSESSALVKGTDYDVYYDSKGCYVELLPDSLSYSAATLNIAYDKAKPEAITASDIEAAADKEMRFYDSEDLKDWNYMSSFGEGYGVQPCQFECPDMVELPVDGDTEHKKWALIVNVNPGCYFGGSATQYFIGDFDGTRFICDSKPDVTKWLDWGKDHYATVSFSNMGRRVIVVPWMSNWQYCNNVPTKPFRGVNALPRELGLYTQSGDIYLSAAPVAEVKNLRKETKEIPAFTVANDYHIESLLPDNEGAYELSLDITAEKAEIIGFSLFNDKGEKVDIYFNLPERKLVMDRTKSGIVDFGKNSVTHEIEVHDRRKTTSINYIDDFALATWAPVRKENKYRLDIFVDKCSVEIFLNEGKIAMSNLVFPTEPYNRMCFYSKGGTFKVDTFKVHRLSL